MFFNLINFGFGGRGQGWPVGGRPVGPSVSVKLVGHSEAEGRDKGDGGDLSGEGAKSWLAGWMQS